MLILVGVSIQLVINSGLFETAKNAGKGTQDKAREEASLGSEIVIDGKTYAGIEDYIESTKPLPKGAGKRVPANATFEYQSNGKTAIIPGGFTVSGVPSEASIDGGLVIYLISGKTDAEIAEIAWDDEETVEAAFFHDDTVFSQEGFHNGGRDAGCFEVTCQRQPWGNDGCLDGIQHIEVWGDVTKTMPVVFCLQDPIVPFADIIFGKFLRSPDLEPPVIGKFIVDFLHRTAEVQCLKDGFFNQGCTARWFHHRCCDVTGCNDGILRRG